MLIAKMEFTFYSRQTLITTKMRFDFEAEDRLTDEGDWTPSDASSKELSRIYFDDVGGWWGRIKAEQGERHYISMREHKAATGISVLWTDFAQTVALLYDVGRLPFGVGNFGNGEQYAQPQLSFQWTVIGL